ncbi:hypothetical protein LCGC14_0984970 [marine sediment metagenome]|uniref:Phage recombination protein Bet n=1 Tax=marine sediment metagenome TaxID=412755 RepID=A0A0F9NTY2_9ZZZZ
MDGIALRNMDTQGMLARIEQAKFPQQLNPQEKAMLAEVAISYGLDPLMKEITIYQGQPFVSIDGRYRKAQESKQLGGVETRPANREEREAWEIPDGDYFMRAEVWRNDASRPFIGWGRVKPEETKPGSSKPGDTTSTFRPIQTNPQRMAEKRAEAQALRKAFHLPLPSIEGETTDPFIEGEFTVAPAEIGVGDPPNDTIDQEEGPDATSEQPAASQGATRGDTSGEKDMRDLISKKVEVLKATGHTLPGWCDKIDTIPRDKLGAAIEWFKDK